MKIKNIPLLMLFLGTCLVAGCTDQIPLSEDSSSSTASSSSTTRSGGDGGFDLLGYGYDGNGEFANTLSAKAKVIDIEKIHSNQQGRINAPLIRNQESHFFGGEDYASYLRSYSEKSDISVFDIVKKKLFGASLNWAFQDSCSASDKYSYASYDFLVQYKQLTLNVDVAEIAKEYVTNEFRQDYQRLTPKALVRRYGNYVLKDIIVGAKLSVAYRSRVTTSNREHTVKAGISASLLSVFNISTNMSYTAADVANNKNYIFSYRTVGGDPSKGLLPSINIDGTPGPINIEPWRNSVTLQNSQLIDIKNHGMIPLYELVDDYDKRYDLMAYEKIPKDDIDNEMLEYGIPLHHLPTHLPKVSVRKYMGSDRMDLSMDAQEIKKPNGTIEFNFKNIRLQADGSFVATNVKKAITTTYSKRKHTDVAKITGKLIKQGNGYRINFTLEGPDLYQQTATFVCDNVSMTNIQNISYTPEGVQGVYNSTFYDINVGTQYPPEMHNKTVEISKSKYKANAINLLIPPFRIYKVDLPGTFSIYLNDLSLNPDGTFHAENIPDLHWDIGWGFDYPVILIDGKFITTDDGIFLKMTLKSKLNVMGTGINFVFKTKGMKIK